MPFSLRFAAVLVIAAALSPCWAAETRHRVFVLTDMGNEPDDSQSMVRLLTYSNRLDLEGLVATTSRFMTHVVLPQLITERINAYGKVRDNLLLHEAGFPTVEYLHAITKKGVPKSGMAGVGADYDSTGSELLIAAVDKVDTRPLWVSVWGGPNTLAQALWKVKQTRSADALATFLSKLRIFAIEDQDDSGAWIRANFPQLFYMYGGSWAGISSKGGDMSLVDNPWIDQHVRNNHGPLGAFYPHLANIMEGDSSSWLYLIPTGLGNPEQPEWGSWGGRYRNTKNRIYSDVEDTWQGQTNQYATIYRWRQAFQNDFQARMDWNVQPYAQANHPPVAVVAGDLMKTASSGSSVSLSAVGSSDPDGNALSYEWTVYSEASSSTNAIAISGATEQNASFVAPKVTSPQTVHVILTVRDNGTPNLFRYQRVIVTVNPSQP